MGLAARTALIALAAHASTGCGASEVPAPAVRRLAVGLVRSADLTGERAWSEVGGALVLGPSDDPACFRVHAPVPAAAWTRVPGFANVWSAPRPFLGTGARDVEGGARRLVGASREYAVATWRGKPSEAVPAGYFAAIGAALYATTDEPAGPGAAEFWDSVELGDARGGVCRTALEGQAGDGFLLAPGFGCELSCELESPAVLFFRSATLGRGEPLSLEVLLGAERVHVQALPSSPRAREASHRVDLPASAPTTLSFRISGAAALCAILAPVLAPRTDPPVPRGADMTLFVADTFRADNLEAYGGEPFLTPHANRLARDGLTFTRAIAPSSWTLPSHASLFTGLYPPELGVQTPRDALTAEAQTLAEALLAAGYRTAAITDDAFVSSEYGLAQGFESFDARRREPEETLQAVAEVLARDDGRPLFLVVHTYRAHHPYVVSTETRASLGARIGLRSELVEAEFASVPESLAGWSPGQVLAPAEHQRMADYEALYRGASADLDRLLGETLALLRARDCDEVVVFTSDHGEAFWEHGVAEHGNGVWNEHVAIPLVIGGTALAPGTRADLASLIDLPRTLAGLAGIPADPRWGGVDLSAGPRARPVLAFQCDLHGQPSSFALFAAGKKLVFADAPAFDPPRLEAAFELELDPEERLDRADQAWARELAARHAREIQAARQRKLEARQALPGSSALEELGQLGYGR